MAAVRKISAGFCVCVLGGDWGKGIPKRILSCNYFLHCMDQRIHLILLILQY